MGVAASMGNSMGGHGGESAAAKPPAPADDGSLPAPGTSRYAAAMRRGRHEVIAQAHVLEALLERAGGNGDALARAFHEMDFDGSNQISSTELREGLSRIGVQVSAHDARQLFDRLDEDANGSVSVREFTHAFRTLVSFG